MTRMMVSGLHLTTRALSPSSQRMLQTSPRLRLTFVSYMHCAPWVSKCLMSAQGRFGPSAMATVS